ncbi:MAG TPA: leucyl/phenylalanyl-tRNA--protein transferase [Desulfosalsimonadaceae bacterium]|nr:leucyl/phenylalanyl-tRNA--protein transferase [Desulfosalsimonadaceae bacterium]
MSFPPPHFAGPEGLLAVGGDLSTERLLLAYRMGIFPWFSDDDPILWWSPDPRLVLYPSEIHVTRRLQRTMRRGGFTITADSAFDRVIRMCAQIRMQSGEGTWITDAMIRAYCRLFDAGYAHCVETWQNGVLVGGLYGVSVGGSFFGESMFSRVSDASKVALVSLARFMQIRDFDMIDCQLTTNHLLWMGAREISRSSFLKQLQESMKKKTLRGPWPLRLIDAETSGEKRIQH